MSDEVAELEEEDDGSEELLDDVDVRELLRAALAVPEEDERKLTRAVQEKIRKESEGRYFADGWSTSRAPKSTYLVTTTVMLAITITMWWLLRPIF